MGGGGIHGGGGQHVNCSSEWEKEYLGNDGALRKQVKKGDTQVKTYKAREKDALEKATEDEIRGLTDVDGKPKCGCGHGHGPRPISLKSDNPNLYQPNTRGANPPKGAGGTGNPFFNINPMAIFFEEFLNMIKMQGQMQLASNRLAVTNAKLIMGMAKDQANAIIQGADAQAAALQKQAVTSFVQAGVQFVMMGASIYGGIEGREEANVERNEQAKVTKDAENALNDARGDVLSDPDSDEAKALTKAEGKLAAKDEMIGDVDKEIAQPRSAVKETEGGAEERVTIREKGAEGEAETTTLDETVEAKAKNQEKLDKKQQEINQKTRDINAKKDEISDKENEINKAEEEYENIPDKASSNAKSKRDEINKLKGERDTLVEEKRGLENEKSTLMKDKQKLAVTNAKLQAKQDYLEENQDLEDKINNVNKKLRDNDKFLEENADSDNLATQDKVQDKVRENNDLVNERDKLLNDKRNRLLKSKPADEAAVGAAQTNLGKNDKIRTAKQKYEEQLTKLQQMDKESFVRGFQNMQNKPWYMALKAGTEGVSQGMQGLSQLFQADGQVKAAAWEADKTQLAAYQQILQASMQAMSQQRSDSYQQANELAGTLVKMSDQEQNSMHWA